MNGSTHQPDNGGIVGESKKKQQKVLWKQKACLWDMSSDYNLVYNIHIT